jgi:hypothetical protein
VTYPPAEAIATSDLAWRVFVTMPIDTVIPEEVAFRGLLLAVLLRRYAVVPAVLLSSLAFTLWHVVIVARTLGHTNLIDDPLYAVLPLGHRLRVRANAYARIIGVVASMRIGPLTSDAPPSVMQLATQQSEILGYVGLGGGVAVRTTGDPEALVPTIRSIVRELEPEWPIHNVERLDVRLGRTLAQPRFYTIALALFAALAVATAVLGLYGVIAYAIERRRLEFGIRRALGAGESHIVRLAAGRAAVLAAIGVAAGSVIAATIAGWLRATLFGIHPLDPASYGSAAALVAVVVLAASWAPARRALQVDPARTLRVE